MSRSLVGVSIFSARFARLDRHAEGKTSTDCRVRPHDGPILPTNERPEPGSTRHRRRARDARRRGGRRRPAAGAVAGAARRARRLQDRLLRMAAEFDNYRKRIDRERREQSDAAAEGVLLDLLPIVDDLERALQAPAAGDAQAYRAGVELIHRQMLDVLRRRGVTPIETAGVALRSATASGRQPGAERRAPRGRDHRGVPARLHAGRSTPAAGDGQGSGFVSKRDYYEVLGVAKTAHAIRRSRAPTASWR